MVFSTVWNFYLLIMMVFPVGSDFGVVDPSRQARGLVVDCEDSSLMLLELRSGLFCAL